MGGFFSDIHTRESSHTGVNTLGDFINRFCALLNLPTEKKYTAHSGKQTLVANGLYAGLDVHQLATTTNNDPATLMKHYAKHHGAQMKIDSAKIINSSMLAQENFAKSTSPEIKST